jgi:hypothetical protein
MMEAIINQTCVVGTTALVLYVGCRPFFPKRERDPRRIRLSHVLFPVFFGVVLVKTSPHMLAKGALAAHRRDRNR